MVFCLALSSQLEQVSLSFNLIMVGEKIMLKCTEGLKKSGDRKSEVEVQINLLKQTRIEWGGAQRDLVIRTVRGSHCPATVFFSPSLKNI